MLKMASLIYSLIILTVVVNLAPAAGLGDVIVVPDSPSMGLNLPMYPAPQLSGDKLIWSDPRGIRYFDGLETTVLSNDSMATPIISGTNAAWRSGMSGRIFIWDGQYIRVVPRLYTGMASTGHVALSGSTVAWTDNDPMGGCQLFLWNGTETIQLSSGMGVEPMHMPEISGSNAVWKQPNADAGGDSIIFWNGTERREIASGMFDPMCVPVISGSNVAWKQYDAESASEQVFFWSGTEVFQISSNDPASPSTITNVKISGNHIVWLTMNGLYHWNGGDITQLAGGSDQPFDCQSFDVSGSYTAWHQRVDGFDRIYFYDGTSTTLVTQPGIQIMPQMYGDTFMMSNSNIAWIQNINGQYHVYCWNGHASNPVGSRDMYSTSGVMLMGISGNSIAWYADGAIFLAKYAPRNCEEALAMGHSIVSDLNRDCKVNIIDLAILANDWMKTFDPKDEFHESPWGD